MECQPLNKNNFKKIQNTQLLSKKFVILSLQLNRKLILLAVSLAVSLIEN